MGIGPVYAIPKALKLAGLTLDQMETAYDRRWAFGAPATILVEHAGGFPAVSTAQTSGITGAHDHNAKSRGMHPP